MATGPTTVYCTSADVQQRASVDGVALRLDDSGAVIDACIEEATVEVNNYCLTFYDVGGLANSDWVRMKTIRLAIFYLCLRRMNKPPASVERARDDILADLEKVRAGRLDISDTYKSHSSAPQLINQRVVLQPTPRLVTSQSRSIGELPVNAYPQRLDPFDCP